MEEGAAAEAEAEAVENADTLHVEGPVGRGMRRHRVSARCCDAHEGTLSAYTGNTAGFSASAEGPPKRVRIPPGR